MTRVEEHLQLMFINKRFDEVLVYRNFDPGRHLKRLYLHFLVEVLDKIDNFTTRVRFSGDVINYESSSFELICILNIVTSTDLIQLIFVEPFNEPPDVVVNINYILLFSEKILVFVIAYFNFKTIT